MIDKAMQEAGEPSGLVARRFAHGDEFFGWQAQDGDVVCYGWVAYKDRAVGPVRIADAPQRAFLFNFHTLAAFRGQSLYTRLLVFIEHVLAKEKMLELVIDANVNNHASSRAIARAGFSIAAEVSYYTLATRWHYAPVRSVLEPLSH